MATAQDALAVADAEVGYSRFSDPEQGTKYGRWYAALTSDGYYGETGVPYCAMFVSWVLDRAGVGCAGLPGAYCPDMLAAARAQGATVDLADARPGDLIYFDWGADGESDHVGIVVTNYGGVNFRTIEGNTSGSDYGSQSNGGVVARRIRQASSVCGIVRPRYDADTPTGAKLSVDGYLGPKSVSEWQRQMGTTVDGVVSGQWPQLAHHYRRLTSVDFGDDGSWLIAEVQRKLGAHDDGIIGPDTIKAIQRFVGVTADGYLGPNTAKAIQRSLNEGKWS